MRMRLRRPRTPEPSMADMLGKVGTALLDEFRRHPVHVEHEIRRYIPRPTVITFTVETHDGQRYRLVPLDLSFRTSQTINFPRFYLTGKPEDTDYVSLFAELHYDPRDRT